MDEITISNFILSMHIGLSEEERAVPQKVCIDLRIWTDFEPVIRSNNLECGVNYASIRRSVRDVAAREFVLLETFGHCIVQAAFREPNVRRVRVRIQKIARWKDAVPGIVMVRRRDDGLPGR